MLKQIAPCQKQSMRGRHGNHARASRHPRWNTQAIINEEGYRKIRVGRAHPMADPHGYAYEHDVIYCSAQGLRVLPPRCLVHHKNEDKSDNRLENLVLLTRREHAILHSRKQARHRGRFAGAQLKEAA
jgi:hypothetical protein